MVPAAALTGRMVPVAGHMDQAAGRMDHTGQVVEPMVPVEVLTGHTDQVAARMDQVVVVG